MKHTRTITQTTGIPSKNYIKVLVWKYLKTLDCDTSRVNVKGIVFNDGYLDPECRTGILWRADKSMEPLIGFHQYLSEHDIKVKQYKYWGQIHSIWIACENGQF